MKRVHLIGIGGAGMSAIARILLAQGVEVSGSDQRRSPTTDELVSSGAVVSIGHDADVVDGADLVIYSAAVPESNPEVVRARALGIEVIDRAEMLGRLSAGFPVRVAIAGTHGKTTTTAMTAVVLERGELDPTVTVGGDVVEWGSNTRVGGNRIFVTEACEAFRSFLRLNPSIAVVTNIDADHLDHYGSMDSIVDAFQQFFENVDCEGVIVACADDLNVRRVAERSDRRKVFYSAEDDTVDVFASGIIVEAAKPSYELVYRGEALGRICLRVPGIHNIRNSLAAAAVGIELGVDFADVSGALADFRGVGRRFEIVAEHEGVLVVDDYAHHPTEIQATLRAARFYGKRIIAIFQPHLYSRTKFFADEFANSLRLADEVFVTDIYAAREQPIEGVTAQDIVERMSSANAYYVPDKSDLASIIFPRIESGDVIITLGAGDIRQVALDLAAAFSGVVSDSVQVPSKP
jgi:UDP-N-acetylmuramate--alanine ligase